MSKYQSLENELMQALALKRRPVAVSFGDTAPIGVKRMEKTAPSGCTFWRLAGAGDTFYTMPEDHYNCPVGSYTHNIPLPPGRANELPDTLGIMTQAGYLQMEEVPGIPVLSKTPKTITYAPLGGTPSEPDVVLVTGTPGKLMLLEEAALRAGVAAKISLLARPTCMAIPAALTHGVVMSAGCVGNRVYTEIGDDELYAAIPGRDLERVCAELQTIINANTALEQHHRGRKATLSMGQA
jgi:uncharacterized protein (DUF169 family)